MSFVTTLRRLHPYLIAGSLGLAGMGLAIFGIVDHGVNVFNVAAAFLGAALVGAEAALVRRHW